MFPNCLFRRLGSTPSMFQLPWFLYWHPAAPLQPHFSGTYWAYSAMFQHDLFTLYARLVTRSPSAGLTAVLLRTARLKLSDRVLHGHGNLVINQVVHLYPIRPRGANRQPSFFIQELQHGERSKLTRGMGAVLSKSIVGHLRQPEPDSFPLSNAFRN